MGIRRGLSMHSNRAVFLDRDGVLIESRLQAGVPHPPPSVASMKILPDVLDSLQELAAADFRLIVVTNQPDVARGKQTRQNVEQINAALRSALPLEAVYVCYHDDADRCDCRKPAPGFLLAGAREFGIDLPASYMVGDRWSDIVAGQEAGCRTLLIARSYSRADRCAPDHLVADLKEAAQRILTENPRTRAAPF
jgi:D-glycero-D-manno-heptose 1,7-bisphosphate phosphatase